MAGRFLIEHETLASALWNVHRQASKEPLFVYATPDYFSEPVVASILPEVSKLIASAKARPIATWDVYEDQSIQQPVIELNVSSQQQLIDVIEYVTSSLGHHYVICSSTQQDGAFITALLHEWNHCLPDLFAAAEKVMQRNHRRRINRLRPNLIAMPPHDDWVSVFGTFKRVSPVAMIDGNELILKKCDEIINHGTEIPYFSLT